MNKTMITRLEYVQEGISELESTIKLLTQQKSQLIGVLNQILNINECECDRCVYCSAHHIVIKVLK